MQFDVMLHETGKWVLVCESEKDMLFYRNESGDLYFFDSEEEALHYLETFEISIIYAERLNDTKNWLSGQALADAAKKLLDEFVKEEDL